MTRYDFGNIRSSTILIQPVDDHDLKIIENEVRMISEMTQTDFRLIALKVNDWNKDLSPWHAPAVFGKEDFGDGAAAALEEILNICDDKTVKYYIGGYSLAGLFSLWAVFRTNVFEGAAAASPSVWFPGFTDYMYSYMPKCKKIYLSLGTKEEKTRNPVMATVADRIRECQKILTEKGVSNILEWNEGNHFRDADFRTARAFAWLIDQKDI